MTRTLEHAREYLAAGLAPIPVPARTKAADTAWRQFQIHPPSKHELGLLFSANTCNIAVVCGRSSGNLVVLDCDSPTTFEDTGHRLGGLGIHTPIVRRPPNGTPHDGGGSFWLRAPVPVATRGLVDLEIRGQAAYVMAPDSEHPGGGRYYFENPGTAIHRLPTLDALGDWLTLEAASITNRKIPSLAWRLLHGNADALARYRTRSEAEAGLCCSLARAGFAFGDVLRLFRRYPGPGTFADKYAVNPEDGRRYLALTWNSATKLIRENEGEHNALARELRTWALSRPWPGRGGSSERAVFLAHLEIVAHCGQQPHDASARRLAELAGVGMKTAARANARLIDAGLLELDTSGTAQLANLWRLVNRPNRHTSSHRRNTMCVTMADSDTGHDAFRWACGGLCKSGGEVLGLLLQAGEPVHQGVIAESTGRGVRTIRRKCRQLFGLGLAKPATEKGRGWWTVLGAPDLDAVAAELGTAGRGAAQKRAHFQQQRYHRELLRRHRGR